MSTSYPNFEKNSEKRTFVKKHCHRFDTESSSSSSIVLRERILNIYKHIRKPAWPGAQVNSKSTVTTRSVNKHETKKRKQAAQKKNAIETIPVPSVNNYLVLVGASAMPPWNGAFV